MRDVPRRDPKEFDRRFRSYKKTPFDKEEKLKIRFDFNEAMTMKERKEEESRKKLFEHRWREEGKMKARQKQQNRSGKAEKSHRETWRDVLQKDRGKTSRQQYLDQRRSLRTWIRGNSQWSVL